MSEVATQPPIKRPPGRPPGRREVAARFTVRLDGARYAALNRLAETQGRSLHSLILEAIDDLAQKRGPVGLS
ncbi:ribbon-helix-helix protein, CopG family [Methylobacterium segetis]|uniref:ribbon-helix-helix protein, CopG family n=1 Tax=Methylobacterium segetis TaxID=2488750 RepID=UPI00104CF408|nr:ribbon-helix-helix protein, CopG family [Methylobacterium segetis]